MSKRPRKLQFGRSLRRRQRQVESFGVFAEEHLEQHFVGRLNRLFRVWRFVASWLGLVVLLTIAVVIETISLNGYYQSPAPVPGGAYTEGILGDFTSANPLYASGPVDTALAKLVFGSLLTYNDQNQLTGELAQSWSVDPSEKVYTVHLKPRLTWQDGKPLTAADVVFTYQTIQNPASQSPLSLSYQDVTVSEIDPLTVSFTLTNPLSSFPDSLTNGIIPAHLLSSVSPGELRGAPFNVAPVGAGPFSWKSLSVQGATPATRQEQISLVPFKGYSLGQPKLSEFIVRAFHDQLALISSFENGELNGAAGLDAMPSALKKATNFTIYNLPLTAANMVFFKTSNPILSDTSVRQALVKAANVNQIILGLGYPVIPVREPLLKGQLAYNSNYQQAAYDPLGAGQQLNADGWTLSPNGLRSKNGTPLKFTLYAADDQDNRFVASSLMKDWQAVGAAVQVVYQDAGSLQNTVTFHTYDALLYGISIGVDPDVYVYWDSSQASPSSASRLNFSEYRSGAADASLDGGRTRLDPSLRSVKYQGFLQAWQQDAPALGLYQPRFLYLTDQPVYGLSEHSINEATGRYNNIQNWEIRIAKVNDKLAD